MTNSLSNSIGQYQIGEFLARGDTAFVYKGYQPSMNRYVAIKILPPSLARNPEIVRRFHQQAELMARLQHRNILPVYDYGQDGEFSYTVSRFAEGGALAKHMTELGTLSDVQNIIGPICEALDFIHQHGLVHGNLKPSNILLDQEGQPLLTDLSVVSETFQTAEDTALGNAYMSPEQALGGAIDWRSDLYALGAILYEMLAGEPPDVGALPSLGSKRPDLPEDLEKIIRKAMAQYPEQRFQSAADFHSALEEVVRAMDQPALPLEPVIVEKEPEPLIFSIPEIEKKQDDRWLYIALGGLVMVVILCGLVAAFAFALVQDSGEEATALPLATAMVDANVFASPGFDYDIVGVLKQGQSARILGQSPDGLWWNIAFPNLPSGQGWVAATAVTTQNSENVPIIVPTPTQPVEMPTEEPPPPSPTVPPPTLVPTEPPPTAVPTEVIPTPIPTEIVPTSMPTAIEPTVELTAEPPTLQPPTEEGLPPYPGQPTEVAPTPIETPGAGGGDSICGLPALAAMIFVVGLALPAKRFRLRRLIDEL